MNFDFDRDVKLGVSDLRVMRALRGRRLKYIKEDGDALSAIIANGDDNTDNANVNVTKPESSEAKSNNSDKLDAFKAHCTESKKNFAEACTKATDNIEKKLEDSKFKENLNTIKENIAKSQDFANKELSATGPTALDEIFKNIKKYPNIFLRLKSKLNGDPDTFDKASDMMKESLYEDLNELVESSDDKSDSKTTVKEFVESVESMVGKFKNNLTDSAKDVNTIIEEAIDNCEKTSEEDLPKVIRNSSKFISIIVGFYQKMLSTTESLFNKMCSKIDSLSGNPTQASESEKTPEPKSEA